MHANFLTNLKAIDIIGMAIISHDIEIPTSSFEHEESNEKPIKTGFDPKRDNFKHNVHSLVIKFKW